MLLGWNYMFIGIGKYMVRKACRGSQDHYTSTHKVGFSYENLPGSYLSGPPLEDRGLRTDKFVQFDTYICHD